MQGPSKHASPRDMVCQHETGWPILKQAAWPILKRAGPFRNMQAACHGLFQNGPNKNLVINWADRF